MKKSIHYIVLFLFISGNLTAQKTGYVKDSSAKVILDRVSEKLSSYNTIIADFELNIDNKVEDLHSKSTGSISIKGNKYYMESLGTQVYFDGKTMWSYMTDINEVTITEPNSEEGDFVDNPALIFTFYNRDFKYRLIGEVKVDKNWMYEIDLYPNDLNQPYSRFKLYIDKKNDGIYMVKAISKDAIDYTIYISNMRYNATIKDSRFIFNEASYDKLEVIDMRF
jgi:outer membrane lipoprotein-sorting protein